MPSIVSTNSSSGQTSSVGHSLHLSSSPSVYLAQHIWPQVCDSLLSSIGWQFVASDDYWVKNGVEIKVNIFLHNNNLLTKHTTIHKSRLHLSRLTSIFLSSKYRGVTCDGLNDEYGLLGTPTTSTWLPLKKNLHIDLWYPRGSKSHILKHLANDSQVV